MRRISLGIIAVVLFPACEGSVAESPDTVDDVSTLDGTGDVETSLRRKRPGTATGGATGAAGVIGSGGALGSGGAVGSGGAISSGGNIGSGGAAAPAGTLVFNGDFETGDLSQWAYVERCQPDRILIYSASNAPLGAPAPRQGKFAARFTVLDSDVAPCTSTENPRAEVETAESLFRPGDERWEAWSLFIPTLHPRPHCPSCIGENWFAIQEDYGAPWDGSPAIGWFLDFGTASTRVRMDRGAQYNHDQPLFAGLPTGRWVDFLVHKKFANTSDGGGFVEAWVDRVPMTFSACNNCTKLSTQTMHNNQRTVGFYLMSYRAKGTFDSFVTYYDGVRIGTSRAAVELP